MSAISSRTVSRRLRRLLLAAALVALLVAGLGNAAHVHAPAKAAGGAHAELCGYCAAWGGVAGPTARPPAAAPAVRVLLLLSRAAAPCLACRILIAAHPRAPPLR